MIFSFSKVNDDVDSSQSVSKKEFAEYSYQYLSLTFGSGEACGAIAES